MKKIQLQKARRKRRKRTIRGDLHGTATRPRLSVFRSNKYIYIQAIDDDNGITLAQSSSLAIDKNLRLTKDSSEKVGAELGNKLKEKKIETAIFDRNGYLYTGRIKAVADGVRKAGIKF